MKCWKLSIFRNLEKVELLVKLVLRWVHMVDEFVDYEMFKNIARSLNYGEIKVRS